MLCHLRDTFVSLKRHDETHVIGTASDLASDTPLGTWAGSPAHVGFQP